ncbi:IS66 family insertion sequence element accessory protein TnpB [Hellea balneolensis]|uniref:IS66 family insertion sequence element accessory protein TnpB n=1 Tax=Hellea balneolensis TaxID=287478 RepID=UPI0012B6C041
MLRGFNSLAALCESQLKLDPFSGHLFVCRGRRRDTCSGKYPRHQNLRPRQTPAMELC